MKARIAFKAKVVTFLMALALFSSAMHAQVNDSVESLRRSPIVVAVEKIGPSVVSINTQKLVNRRSLFGDVFDFGETDARSRGGRYQNYSLGSGVIIDEKGYVITNDHVVQRADIITVSLSDGREFPATLIGSDIQNDIAILKVHADTKLPAASLGRSGDILLGETAIAVGNPFGLGGSVTAGIVSAINRTVNFRSKKKFTDFIQTSAVINPGNSGGPLINITGDVIGINVAIHSRGPGIGFAIPISRVREVVYRVLDPRINKEAIVGIDIDHLHEGSGAVVRAVDRDGPASSTGLVRGDKILSVNDERIEDWIDFQTTVQELKIGQKVRFDYLHDGRRKSSILTITRTPPTPAEQAIFSLCGFVFKDLPKSKVGSNSRYRGVLVTAVPKNSSAAAVGIQVGDIVYSLARTSVHSKDLAFRVLQRYSTRKSIPVHLYRPTENAYYSGELPLGR